MPIKIACKVKAQPAGRSMDAADEPRHDGNYLKLNNNHRIPA
jgi:hypothetical protein